MIDPINVRFRELRKALGLNTTQIGDAIGLSNSGISCIEAGQRKVSDKHIKLLKVAFPLMSEHWLRTGEGEMFIQISRDQEIMDFVADTMQDDKDNFRRRFLLALSRLPEERWADIEDFARQITAESKKAEQD